jgi:hypothetical protein
MGLMVRKKLLNFLPYHSFHLTNPSFHAHSQPFVTVRVVRGNKLKIADFAGVILMFLEALKPLFMTCLLTVY